MRKGGSSVKQSQISACYTMFNFPARSTKTGGSTTNPLKCSTGNPSMTHSIDKDKQRQSSVFASSSTHSKIARSNLGQHNSGIKQVTMLKQPQYNQRLPEIQNKPTVRQLKEQKAIATAHERVI